MLYRRVFTLIALALCSCSGGGSTAPALATTASPVASAAPTPSAVATGSVAPTPTGAPTATVTSTSGALAAANVAVGAGYSDVSPHQVVRSSADVAYIAVPTCTSPPQCNGNALVMYAGGNSGTPSSFTALDTADEPQALSSSDSIGASAMAIDGNDLLWVAWTERASGGTLQIANFDVATGTWSAPQEILGIDNTGFTQGFEGVTLALDANGAPHVAYDAEGSDGKLHIMYTNRTSGSWSTPVRVDDETIASGSNAIHPTMAFAPDGSLLFAWLDGPVPEYSPGSVRTRVRSAAGAFSPSTLIAGEALITLDDGPSLLVTADGTRHLTFIGPSADVVYWYGPDGVTWHGDRQPPLQESHDPSLGTDGAGGVYIYGHGTPEPQDNGTGVNLYRFHLAAGANVWSPFALWVSGAYDCSVSTRWSQFFMRFPTELDSIYWTTSAPNMLLLGEG